MSDFQTLTKGTFPATKVFWFHFHHQVFFADSPSNTILFLSPKMSVSAAALTPEKFSPFHIHSTSYKVVNGHPISVDILVPKNLESGTKKCPLMVRFHGGFLVSNSLKTSQVLNM